MKVEVFTAIVFSVGMKQHGQIKSLSSKSYGLVEGHSFSTKYVHTLLTVARNVFLYTDESELIIVDY